MTTKTTRAALYLRVSTGEQSTHSQRLELEAAAMQRGWKISEVYEDAGISGAKGRDRRPAFDTMLKDAVRGRFDVLMAWSVDRLGRSLIDLVGMLGELKQARIDLFLHRQAVDTSTAGGKALFQMLGVFAEFERSMIQERVKAGMARARAEGKQFGRPLIHAAREAEISALLSRGVGVNKIAYTLGVGNSVVQRVKRDLMSVREVSS
jgi:DNA invertase Pin-like site-specific DNA recombinase